MPLFKKLNTAVYQKASTVATPDYIYWKKLGVPVLVKEFGPIDYIDFCPIEPHYFAVTCSVRVQVYNPITKLVVKNLSRFRENAYGATFRPDGRLICAGGEETNVKLFDVSTKSLLRLFKGHTRAVHRSYFMHTNPYICSFSDDKTVKVWDIPTEVNITTYSGHNDYVRAGAMCLAIPDIVLSGGYDGLAKMYDVRAENETISVNHGCPIESVLFLPSGGIFLTAGGTEIKIWDTIAGGKLLGCLSQHHKTITCLRLASDNKRLLSSSLDRHVKIYDVSTFQTVHTMDFPNAVVSLGVSKNDDTLVAGLADGLVSVSRREEGKDEKEEKNKKNMSSYRFDSNVHSAKVDVIVPEVQHEKEAHYDHHLRKFEFSKALNSVLLPYVANKKPQVTVALIQELIRRRALHKALQNNDKKHLSQLLRFLIRNITDYRFTRVLTDATNIVIDIYEESISTLPIDVRKLFIDLGKVLNEELELVNTLGQVHGMISMLLASQVTEMETVTDKRTHNLVPSTDAQKNLVLTIT